VLRHKGKRRTYAHNLRLASLLSFVAGIVNITGVLSVKTLTTNVTGHFAYFAENFAKTDYTAAFVFLIFILSFLLGAFTSNLLIEIVLRIKPRMAQVVPMGLEILILVLAGSSETLGIGVTQAHVIACGLLFAMGIQNSLVTKISDSVVRTTHLTGLFTDLGIEMSQMFFFRKADERSHLTKRIFLRLAIILFFFLGCIIGSYAFKVLYLKTLFIASAFLLLALSYDNIRYRYYRVKRKRKTS
jgi:uncharacterized membrane protein YoaK (UPF0700 family)